MLLYKFSRSFPGIFYESLARKASCICSSKIPLISATNSSGSSLTSCFGSSPRRFSRYLQSWRTFSNIYSESFLQRFAASVPWIYSTSSSRSSSKTFPKKFLLKFCWDFGSLQRRSSRSFPISGVPPEASFLLEKSIAVTLGAPIRAPLQVILRVPVEIPLSSPTS